MTRPTFIAADEVTITNAEGQPGHVAHETRLLFDVEGDRVIVLWDARPMGGPVVAFGLAATTTYSMAMALLQMRRRVLRASKEKTAELRPSRTEAPFPP